MSLRNLIALSVQIDEPPAPASETGCVGKAMGDRRDLERTAPGPSGDIFPGRGSGLIVLGILDKCCVDAIRLAPARRRRPGESVAGGNKTNLAGPRGDRPLSQRHQAGRDLGHLRRDDPDSPTRGAVDRHGESASTSQSIGSSGPI
jgi:hypothetical protein